MATTLEFGIMDGFGDIARYATAAEGYDQHIRDAVLGERLGYRYYFFVEHQNATFNYVSSPSVYLASLARETTSLRFGPMVYQLPMYHPMRLAQDTAVLDNLSHGRLDFGAGFGIQAHEFIRWKLPFGERRAMGEEVMDIVLKAWTQDEVTYDGQYWKFDEALPKPKPYQQPYPPVGWAPTVSARWTMPRVTTSTSARTSTSTALLPRSSRISSRRGRRKVTLGRCRARCWRGTSTWRPRTSRPAPRPSLSY